MKLDTIAALATERTGDAAIVPSPASSLARLPRAEEARSVWTDERGACDETLPRAKGAADDWTEE